MCGQNKSISENGVFTTKLSEPAVKTAGSLILYLKTEHFYLQHTVSVCIVSCNECL